MYLQVWKKAQPLPYHGNLSPGHPRMVKLLLMGPWIYSRYEPSAYHRCEKIPAHGVGKLKKSYAGVHKKSGSTPYASVSE